MVGIDLFEGSKVDGSTRLRDIGMVVDASTVVGGFG